jgi:hypothetical protein
MNSLQIRFPGAAQRHKRGYARLRRAMAVRCRPGIAKIWNGPGSAVHNFVPLALRGIRDTRSCS